jgi:hypothetical protein
MFKLYKSQRLLGLIFFISLAAGAITTLNAQAWFDADWEYRRPVTIANPGGTELTEYQVKISLDNTFNFTSANSDGSDIRITADDGTTTVPFWIEDWNPAGTQATIWVKVPTLPVEGLSVYLYYGNPSPIIPPPDPVETPPIGPFTRAVGNPIVPSGATGTSLLAENIVFDPVTGHYWMCLANYSQSAISLCYSDTPTDPSSWIWSGNVITTFSIFYSGAPHLMLEGGTWYLFYADRPNILVATASNVAGPYTINPTPVLSPSGPTPAWDAFRVDEPYVFKRLDGKWIIIYMGDAGSVTEQVGYATADYITGPYTAYSGNPVIRFGDPGSFDAGTVADPWVYEYHGVYYIGYTVSSTKNSPWQTALATTTDWINFTKHGIILPASGTPFDNANSFRGAITRIGDTYVFSYTGGGYGMGIATQPVYMSPPDIINNRDAVFDFYDEFDGSSLNSNKWTIVNGQITQATVSEGLLTLYSPNDASFVRIFANNIFGMNYIIESRASHPDQGTQDLIAEVGFTNSGWSAAVRIVDDFKNGTLYWQRQARSTATPDEFINMAQTADPNWHIFRVFRQGTNTAGFQIDNNTIETTTTNVPTIVLSPFLMSYGIGNDFVVDWLRVRKYAAVEPTTTVGEEAVADMSNIYISSDPTVVTSTIYPNVNWGMPDPLPPGYPGTPVNDWDFTVPIELYIVPEVGSVFGASDITIQWDNSLYSYAGVENSGIYSVSPLFVVTYGSSGTKDSVIINASRDDNANFAISTGQYIAKLNLNLLRPGFGLVSFSALDFRAFNGLGGQYNVYLIGNNAQVKSYLGDVASTSPASSSTGDGILNIDDLTFWSGAYWSGVPPTGMDNYKVKYDVGPTSTNNVYGIPAVDGKIQFEDFVIFAMSYGLSAGGIYPKLNGEPTEPVDLQLGEPIIAGCQTRIPLFVSGGVQNVRAMSLMFAGQFGKLVNVEKGSLLTEFTNPVMVMSNTDGNQVYVDLAVFGAEEVGINTEGEVLTLVFEGNTEINISTADIRNILNSPMAVNISGTEGSVPTEFALMQNYPNPFNPTTTINYALPTQAMVEISIYNALGERVATLVNEIKEAGRYTVEFNATGYSSGIYFYQIKANDYVSVKKMILMK